MVHLAGPTAVIYIKGHTGDAGEPYNDHQQRNEPRRKRIVQHGTDFGINVKPGRKAQQAQTNILKEVVVHGAIILGHHT